MPAERQSASPSLGLSYFGLLVAGDFAMNLPTECLLIMSLCESPVYLAVLLLTIIVCVVCNIGLAIDQKTLYLSSLVTASGLVLLDTLSMGLMTASHSFRCWRLVLESALWGLSALIAAAALQFQVAGLVTFVTVLYAVRSVIRIYLMSEDFIKESHPNRTIEEFSVALPQIELAENVDEDQDKESELAWRNSVATTADEA